MGDRLRICLVLNPPSQPEMDPFQGEGKQIGVARGDAIQKVLQEASLEYASSTSFHLGAILDGGSKKWRKMQGGECVCFAPTTCHGSEGKREGEICSEDSCKLLVLALFLALH